MTVAELGDRISSPELGEWAAYEKVFGPVGPQRGDVNVAMLASVIANVNRAKGKKPFKIADFLIEWDKEDEPVELTPEEQRAQIMRMLGARGDQGEKKQLLGPKGEPITSETTRPTERE